MNAINLELNQLREIQEITATRAKELVPDATLSVQFNYENTSISKEAARVGAVSLGKSETDWANSWKGDVATTKIIDGNIVWVVVSRVDGVHKGAPIKVGDIMKAAGWAQAAKHSRGSIFDKEMHKSFSWTGPNYL